jgi:hypothetical protein
LELNILNHQQIKITKNIKPVKGLFFKKYGKDVYDIYSKIEKMSIEELEEILLFKSYMTIEIDETLFNINYIIENCDSNFIFKEFSFSTNKMIAMINKDYDEMVDKKYYNRLVATSIQKCRKLAELHPWDKIEAYWDGKSKYNLEDDENTNYIEDIIRIKFSKYKERKEIFFENSFEEELGIKIILVKV